MGGDYQAGTRNAEEIDAKVGRRKCGEAVRTPHHTELEVLAVAGV